MAFRDSILHRLRPLVFLSRNIVSLIGAVLTTSSAITLVAFWSFQLIVSPRIPPYFGLLFYLILPSIFVFGLILIPVGALWRRHSLHRQRSLPAVYPRVDLRDPVLKRTALWVGGLTILNVIITGAASYRGVEYLDSVSFCGQTCHTVMEPEYTAYLNSPHSRVECVSCHIGPGASWFVRSKLSGVHQVFAVLFHTYDTPIPSPVEDLRPAQETCEQCHWPAMFQGDRLLIRTSFADDEANTQSTTVLLMRVGGVTWDRAIGIHGRHLEPANRVQYVAVDRARQVIPVVRYVEDNGSVTTYTSGATKVTPEELANGQTRTMDCVDCHNRPTHTFHPATEAVDQSMAEGHIDPTIPFIKKKAVEVLEAHYPERDAATREITAALDGFYRNEYPKVYEEKSASLRTSIEEVGNIYLRNVFPAMKVTWGTYANNIGHMNTPGCFRCHDDNHVSKEGKTITQDCTACHALLAIEEQNPSILSQLEIQNPRTR